MAKPNIVLFFVIFDYFILSVRGLENLFIKIC